MTEKEKEEVKVEDKDLDLVEKEKVFEVLDTLFLTCKHIVKVKEEK